MMLSKKHISAVNIVMAASIFIGSNSFVFAATPTSDGSATPGSSTTGNSTGGTKASTTTNAGTAATAAAAPAGSQNDSAAKASAKSATSGDASDSSKANAAVKTSEPNTNTTSSTDEKNSTDPGTASGTAASSSTTTKWHPGVELSIGTDTQDLVPTDDPELARKQVEAYPDSPEAAFIYAVALTRTSRVEEALQQVRAARKLADKKGGATYFDKMIGTYEDLLKNYPKENRVRYGLAWAYYMKAYLLSSTSRKVAKWKAANDPATKAALAAANGAAATPPPGPRKNQDLIKMFAPKSGKGLDFVTMLSQANQASSTPQGASALPKVPEIMEGVEAQDIPQIRKYFELALGKMDELIAQKPDDVWALVYRAHLKAEYDGDIDNAMKVWKQCSEKFPNNPASYFFLGTGYLKKGDMKQSIINVSKAVALRGTGN